MKSKWDGMEIYEGERIPWWGRIWRWNYCTDTAYVLPIPICYISRFLWKIWGISFRIRPSRYEKEMRKAYHAGFKAGWDKLESNIARRFEKEFGRPLLEELGENLLG